MQLDLSSENDHLLVKTCGRITYDQVASGEDPLAQASGFTAYSGKILLDLSGSEYIDTSGISWLLACHKRSREAQGVLVLHSIPPLVWQTLKILQLDRVFLVAVDLPAGRRMVDAAQASPGKKPAVGGTA
jgi:anti-anti-sigma factor